MSAAIERRAGAVNPDLLGEADRAHADANAPHYGWNASYRFDTSDRTCSRAIGHDALEVRTCIEFVTIRPQAPNEDVDAMVQAGVPEGKVGSARITRPAATCARDAERGYEPKGFVLLHPLTGLTLDEAQGVVDSILPPPFAARALVEIFNADGNGYLQVFGEENAEEAGGAALEVFPLILSACERAWVWLAETLDESENEVKAAAGGHAGKKKFDRLDEHAYAETGRVKPDLRAMKEQEGLGHTIADKLAAALGASRQPTIDEATIARIVEERVAAALSQQQAAPAAENKGKKTAGTRKETE